MSTRELIEKEIADLPEPLQREVFNFARFLRTNRDDSFNGLLLSETALAKDWNTPEEDPHGQIEKWNDLYMGLSSLLGGKQEGKFEAFGDGYLFFTKNSDTMTVFIQKSGDKSHRLLSIRKING